MHCLVFSAHILSSPCIAAPCALVPPVHPLVLGQQRVDVVARRQQRQRGAGVCTAQRQACMRARGSG